MPSEMEGDRLAPLSPPLASGYSSGHSLGGDLTIRNSPWSEVPGIGYRPLSPLPIANTSFPAAVVRYLCFLLVGLSSSTLIGGSADPRDETWT